MAQPLIELRVLRQRAVATTNLTGLMVGFAMFSSFLLIPQFAQAPESTGYGFGFSVTQAGLILTPAAVAQLLAGPLAGRLGVVIGFRTDARGRRRRWRPRPSCGSRSSTATRGTSSCRARCSAPASRSRWPRWRT